MKYRTKMILVYATIAFLISLTFGFLVYRNSVRYEIQSEKDNLVVSARSYASQMEDRLGRMDAILNYILSDPKMLESITLLGRASDGILPHSYRLEAENILQTGVSTEYIIRNSYRTVFFNQDAFLASSAVRQSGSTAFNQRLVGSFQIEDIDYLAPVIEADGKTVIVGKHNDFWGAYGEIPVYSLMKAPRGYRMGFLEVENRIDSLAQLENSDTETDYAIFINGSELLYDSGGGGTGLPADDSLTRNREAKTQKETEETEEKRPEETVRLENGIYYTSVASDLYDLTVLTYKSESMMAKGKKQIFLTSFLTALVMFGLSLLSIVLWSSRLTRPVKQLQEIVESTSIENLQDSRRVRQIEQGSRNLDEFTDLAHAYRSMTGRLNEALQNEKRSAMLQLQAQFDTLQTQVNPHFIYNVLNIISSRAVMDGDEVICEMCGCLGSMLRYSTNNKARYARIEEELKYLDSYFYLLKSRYENRLQVRIEPVPQVLDKVIPKMTLQQIVENSIKHGFHDTDVNMEISLTARQEDDGWYVRIRDNGTGVSPEKLQEIHEKLAEVRESFRENTVPTETQIGGIGLTNTYARCLLLYRDGLIFDLENGSDGAGFEVKIGCRERPGTTENT